MFEGSLDKFKIIVSYKDFEVDRMSGNNFLEKLEQNGEKLHAIFHKRIKMA